jgi:hypothetical protein
MKMIKNLETWLLYGGSLDERIRMGLDKAGYLGFLVMLFGGTGLAFYHRLSGRATPETFSWFGLLILACLVYSVALVARGATCLDTRKQQKALLKLGIFSVPFLYALMWLFSKKVNIWYQGASPIALLGMAITGSVVVVLFAWLMNNLARKRNETLSRTQE